MSGGDGGAGGGRIERDRTRFQDIVRGAIKRDLRRYVTGSELIGRKGRQLISIPVPRIELPRFRFGKNGRGKGSGEGEGEGEGQAGEGGSAGAAGGQAGSHLLEVELSLEELAAILGEELELPRIEPRGRARISSPSRRFSALRRTGPRSLRHMRRTYREALKRQIVTGSFDPKDPRIVPGADDLRFRSWKETSRPDHAAMILYMMDVSGSMGREQKEIVRLVSFWIDTWLRSQYQSLETRYVVHDAVAKEVDQQTFYRLRESGGTKISSAYALAADLLEQQFPASEWNIYLFHFSDGDNWSGRDTEKCMSLLRERLLPACNLFCYGQVKSAYGSGQFKKDVDGALAAEDIVITAEILDREGILPAIKSFLGTGL
ncbi:MAG TPA: DUF444 family protein [Planctomycetota bacterium]|nr:DUF444 family protein [Planctomycetota bacterium]